MKYNAILVIIVFISSMSMVFIINNHEQSNKPQLNLVANEQIQKKVNAKKKINNSKKIIWDVIDSWEKIPGSNFSLANYKINNLSFEAEISITQFPGNAGGIENNVNRWRKQLDLENQKIETIVKNADYNNNDLGEFSIHKIINNESQELAFLCMIQSLDDSTVFIKLKTTLNGINQLKSMFYKFCLSLRYSK